MFCKIHVTFDRIFIILKGGGGKIAEILLHNLWKPPKEQKNKN